MTTSTSEWRPGCGGVYAQGPGCLMGALIILSIPAQFAQAWLSLRPVCRALDAHRRDDLSIRTGRHRPETFPRLTLGPQLLRAER